MRPRHRRRDPTASLGLPSGTPGLAGLLAVLCHLLVMKQYRLEPLHLGPGLGEGILGYLGASPLGSDSLQYAVRVRELAGEADVPMPAQFTGLRAAILFPRQLGHPALEGVPLGLDTLDILLESLECAQKLCDVLSVDGRATHRPAPSL